MTTELCSPRRAAADRRPGDKRRGRTDARGLRQKSASAEARSAPSAARNTRTRLARFQRENVAIGRDAQIVWDCENPRAQMLDGEAGRNRPRWPPPGRLTLLGGCRRMRGKGGGRSAVVIDVAPGGGPLPVAWIIDASRCWRRAGAGAGVSPWRPPSASRGRRSRWRGLGRRARRTAWWCQDRRGRAGKVVKGRRVPSQTRVGESFRVAEARAGRRHGGQRRRRGSGPCLLISVLPAPRASAWQRAQFCWKKALPWPASPTGEASAATWFGATSAARTNAAGKKMREWYGMSNSPLALNFTHGSRFVNPEGNCFCAGKQLQVGSRQGTTRIVRFSYAHSHQVAVFFSALVLSWRR